MEQTISAKQGEQSWSRMRARMLRTNVQRAGVARSIAKRKSHCRSTGNKRVRITNSLGCRYSLRIVETYLRCTAPFLSRKKPQLSTRLPVFGTLYAPFSVETGRHVEQQETTLVEAVFIRPVAAGALTACSPGCRDNAGCSSAGVPFVCNGSAGHI